MKTSLIVLAVLSVVPLAVGQEKLQREEALTYARAVSVDAKQLNGTPLATDVDIQQPVALRDEDYGGMVLPQKRLSAETLAQAGTNAVPVGQLWFHKLAPMRDGRVLDADKLRVASVSMGGETARVPQCALGIRRTGGGTLELVVYGKEKEPLLATPLKAIDVKQEVPIDLAAEREYDSGRLTLRILGKYQATFPVTELEL